MVSFKKYAGESFPRRERHNRNSGRNSRSQLEKSSRPPPIQVARLAELRRQQARKNPQARPPSQSPNSQRLA